MASDPYVNDFDSLCASLLNAEARENTAGRYWYTVVDGHLAHTAFRTREELLEWAEVRGLAFGDEVPEPDPTAECSTQIAIVGGYSTASHMDVDNFLAISADRYTQVLSNAEYTLGKVTIDSEGRHTVHYLNVNVRGDVYPWGRGTDKNTVGDYVAAL